MKMNPQCRNCGTRPLTTVVDLGQMPLANAFVETAYADRKNTYYPLHARFCKQCLLVQVDDVVPVSSIFSHYAYFSSYSSTWLKHAEDYTHYVVERFKLNRSNFIVEIASNDGYLLRHFIGYDIPILGVEPAKNVAEIARNQSIPTEGVFFNESTAKELLKKYPKADLMIANNVLAHVPDLHSFMAGFKVMLATQGVISFEFPSLLNLINYTQFDTIYHEHFSYLSLLFLQGFFKKYDLRIFDVEELATHGGSYRVWVCHENSAHIQLPAVHNFIEREMDAKLDCEEAYLSFASRVATTSDAFIEFVEQARANNKKIIAYGAAAKGNTLLNYCKMSCDDISYIVDLNIHKQNKLAPGSHIPIASPTVIDTIQPDYIVILPWNIKDEIIATLQHVREWGCQFVIVSPKLDIV